MSNKKEVLLINDLPGVGQVALCAMIPILSNMGLKVNNLPTALVSNTFDYGIFHLLDLTEYMRQTIAIWKKLQFRFDCFCIGFLNSQEQVSIIQTLITEHSNPLTIVMLDPIMGDNGKLYKGENKSVILNMRSMLQISHIITPNYTEACYLANGTMETEHSSKEQTLELVERLKELGARSVVVTSCHSLEGEYYIYGYSHWEGEYFWIDYPYVDGKFAGTGDTFSAVLIGHILKGATLKEACKIACNFVSNAIEEKGTFEENKRKE